MSKNNDYILLVEDDDSLRCALKLKIEALGYPCVAVNCGQEAIPIFRENPARILLTDIVMPNGNGLEMIQDLRQDFPDLNAIVASGSHQNSPQVKQLGVEHIYDKFQLLANLKMILDQFWTQLEVQSN